MFHQIQTAIQPIARGLAAGAGGNKEKHNG